MGFGESDRVENIRRIAEVSKLMNDAGLIVIVAVISPFSADRKKAREIIGDCFIEIFVNTPLDICEKRDIKGLYSKARKGEISNFTGIDSPYEIPNKPEIVIDTVDRTVDDGIEKIMKYLEL